MSSIRLAICELLEPGATAIRMARTMDVHGDTATKSPLPCNCIVPCGRLPQPRGIFYDGATYSNSHSAPTTQERNCHVQPANLLVLTR